METLAALEPSPFPVISLYLSLTPNEVGRENWDQFVRKVFKVYLVSGLHLPGAWPSRYLHQCSL